MAEGTGKRSRWKWASARIALPLVIHLTDFGYNPAWSPDGKEIVFGTASRGNPASRFAFDSQLWVVNASSG